MDEKTRQVLRLLHEKLHNSERASLELLRALTNVATNNPKEAERAMNKTLEVLEQSTDLDPQIIGLLKEDPE